MPSFLTELWSTEKSYAVPFKEISHCSSFVKSFERFLNKNFTNLCYHSPKICKSLFYLHTGNSPDHLHTGNSHHSHESFVVT